MHKLKETEATGISSSMATMSKPKIWFNERMLKNLSEEEEKTHVGLSALSHNSVFISTWIEIIFALFELRWKDRDVIVVGIEARPQQNEMFNREMSKFLSFYEQNKQTNETIASFLIFYVNSLLLLNLTSTKWIDTLTPKARGLCVFKRQTVRACSIFKL